MGFDKIEAVSLTDQFVHKVESMIISGELMPGDQLPPARELSARMGVSRPVISAGLIELEKMGFVDVVARQGVYVSDYRKTGSLDTLTALLNYNGGVMRDDEVRSLMEVRSANECLCVKLVVERATQDELDGLAPMLDAIKDAKTDQEGAEATFQFHHALSVLSRNTFLPLLYNSIHSYGLHFWSLYRQRYGAKKYPLNLSLANFAIVFGSILNIVVQGAVGGDNRLAVFMVMGVLSLVAAADVLPFSKKWNSDMKMLEGRKAKASGSSADVEGPEAAAAAS